MGPWVDELHFASMQMSLSAGDVNRNIFAMTLPTCANMDI